MDELSSTRAPWWSRLLRWSRGERIAVGLDPWRPTIQAIRAVDLAAAPDAALTARTAALRASARAGTPLAALAPELGALVLAAARRALGLELHDCQLAAGLALGQRLVVELPTGEGKTLAAVLPAALQALSGQGVHVLTFNDFLARRDAAWMGPVYRLLGLTVGCVQEGQDPDAKRAAYACDVTYATAKEAGFDFLRDGLVQRVADRVHRPLHAVLLDEADSLLLDEARVPLVIASADAGVVDHGPRLAALVRTLQRGRDYDTDAEHRSVFLTEEGIRRVEDALGQGGLYDAANHPLLAAVSCALHAEVLLRAGVDYLVRDGRIEIVDEFTGRVMDLRHWPDGLQAAVEAKEGVAAQGVGRILGTLTLQGFCARYPHLAGMTATALSAADELREVFDLGVAVLPPHLPSCRQDLPDALFTHGEAKGRALLAEIVRVHGTGRPILVGTASVRESEALARDLAAAGVPCQVLNAWHDEQEAAIIAEAGRLGAVTVSTNMAGRGTDIRLGGADERERDAVLACGGLLVLGTGRQESLRLDRQLRGRAGRQGDPGASRLFVALDDDLFVRHGLAALFQSRYAFVPQEEELSGERLPQEVRRAQRIIEGSCGDLRRSLHQFTRVVERQQEEIQRLRDAVLADAPPWDWRVALPELCAAASVRGGAARLDRLQRQSLLQLLDQAWADHLAALEDLRESIHLVHLAGQSLIQEFEKRASEVFRELLADLEEEHLAALGGLLELDEAAWAAAEQPHAPAATWTYLVHDEHFGWNLELLQGRHIGSSAVAAAVFGPLFLLLLLVRRFRGRSSPG